MAKDPNDDSKATLAAVQDAATKATTAATAAGASADRAHTDAHTASTAAGSAQGHSTAAQTAATAAQQSADPPEPSWIYGMVIGFLGVALLVLVVAMVVASLTGKRTISGDVESATTLILGGLIGVLAPTPATRSKKKTTPTGG